MGWEGPGEGGRGSDQNSDRIQVACLITLNRPVRNLVNSSDSVLTSRSQAGEEELALASFGDLALSFTNLLPEP